MRQISHKKPLNVHLSVCLPVYRYAVCLYQSVCLFVCLPQCLPLTPLSWNACIKKGTSHIKNVKYLVFLSRPTLSHSWGGAQPICHPRGPPSESQSNQKYS